MNCLTRANEEIRELAEMVIRANANGINAQLARDEPNFQVIAIYANAIVHSAKKIANLPK